MAIRVQCRVEDVQNPCNPFYVHPSESPSLVLVTVPLNGGNFHGWQRSMRMSLLTKNKLGFVDGSIEEPEQDDPIFPFWQRCNTLVVAWMIRSIDPEIALSVQWIDNARALWIELQERFSHADQFRISNLKEEIYHYRQGNLTVTSYFTGLKALFDELDVLNAMPVCVCNAECTCNALARVQDQRNAEYVARFLKGLGDQFSSVRSQIMLLSPLPTLNKAFSLII